MIKMIKFFLRTTDTFLCENVKTIFKKLEDQCPIVSAKENLVKELDNFEFDPLIGIKGEQSRFEKKVKFQVKIMLGIFFVAIPMIGFSTLSYIWDINYTYAFVLTQIIAFLATIRMDEIAKRYVSMRKLQLNIPLV